nr:hypothetical protein [Streptomyces hygroscopicus]
MKLIKRASLVASATAAAVMALSATASAVTLNFNANGPADGSCTITTKGWGSYTYYANGGVKGGYQAYAGGFDVTERDTCSDGYGAVLHLTYYKWNGSSWVYTTADPIKVTTGAGTQASRSWTFEDVRDVKIYSCRINSAGGLSLCASAAF